MTEAYKQSLIDLVYLENRLLDERRFEEWYELFADDGIYWVPAHPDQCYHESEASIALENKLLLKLRIERLNHARAHSLSPEVRSMRVVQRPHVAQTKNHSDLHEVSCNVFYIEAQGSDQLTLGAKVDYQLRDAGTLKIVQKRVQLLNADAALPAIQLFI